MIPLLHLSKQLSFSISNITVLINMDIRKRIFVAKTVLNVH